MDSAPVLERTWAQKSGLGWIGKNGNLINKNNYNLFIQMLNDIFNYYIDGFKEIRAE